MKDFFFLAKQPFEHFHIGTNIQLAAWFNINFANR